MKKILLLMLVLTIGTVWAQDSTQSLVVKKKFEYYRSVVRLKYPEFSLSDSYYLVKDANDGKTTAQHELGIRYLIGKGFEPDTAKAVYWIKKAAEKKLVAACFNYGIMLMNQVGVSWNPFEAYKNFVVAADGGMPEAELIVGLFYLDDLIVAKNINKAVEWIDKAAKQKYKPAEEALVQVKENEGKYLNFAWAYNKPQVDEKKNDQSESEFNFEWFADADTLKKSLENPKEKELMKKAYTDLKKILNIKKCEFLEMQGDTTQDRLLKQGIKWGNPESVIVQGTSYQNGTLEKKDLIMAAYDFFKAYRLGAVRAGNMLYKITTDKIFLESLEKAMEKGNLDAIYVWSAITAMQFSNKFTQDESINMLAKSAEKGHIPSMVELGLCYYNGRVVKQDRKAALELWNRAANLGDEDAKIRIAFNNLLNSESPNSLKNDYDYLLKASDNGNLIAEIAIGYCYEKGIVVKQNKSEANKIYESAVRRGSETALVSLKRLYNELRPDEETFKIYTTN